MASLGITKIIAAQQSNFGTTLSLFTSELTHAFAGAGDFTLPQGVLFIPAQANVTIEYTPDSGTTWKSFGAAGAGGMVVSDGYNWRVAASAALTFTYFGIA